MRKAYHPIIGILSLVLLLAGSNDARAEGDVFSATVTLSAEAENGVLAKADVMRAAPSRALERVMRRVISRGAWQDLPEVDPETIEKMVEVIEVRAEVPRPNSYRATLNIRFHPPAIEQLLAGNALRFVDRPAPPILILPILVEDGVPLVFDDAGIWRQALEDGRPDDVLVSALFPKDSHQDREARVSLLRAADGVTLDFFRIRYRTIGTVVVEAERVSGRDAITVSILGRDAAGSARVVETVARGGLAAAAEAVWFALDDRWKENAGRGPGVIVSSAGMPQDLVANAEAWAEAWGDVDGSALLADKLRRATAVRAFSFVGGQSSKVRLWFDGDPDLLVERLAAQGVRLVERPGGWALSAN